MKIYLQENVFDSSLERIRYFFEEFDNVVVAFSGGKDSTVTLELALIVAREKNRLPLTVFWIDQEAEWQSVADYAKSVMYREEVNPHWLQVPIRLFNATTTDYPWLNCWSAEEEHMRERDPISIKVNDYGTDRFYKMFDKYLKKHYPNESVAMLGGVRAEESPARKSAVGNAVTYKHITYGKVHDKERDHYSFYPIYDWSYTDIWKAIHDNSWEYTKIYDAYYRYGIAPRNMRVSNLHHETAIHQLFYLHELEADTWNALTKRLKGVNQTKHMLKTEMFAVQDLPYMFSDWVEYRDYLIEKLIVDDDTRAKFISKYQRMDEKFEGMDKIDELHRRQIAGVLANDFEFAKIEMFEKTLPAVNFWKFKRGIPINWNAPESYLRYIKKEERLEA